MTEQNEKSEALKQAATRLSECKGYWYEGRELDSDLIADAFLDKYAEQNEDQQRHQDSKLIVDLTDKVITLQAQLDKAQSQILTLRLIADRAATLLLTGSTPDLAHMTQEQGEAIAAYTGTSDYGDMAGVDSAEQALIDLVVRPLNQLAAGEPETIDLLKLAMREIEREKKIKEEQSLLNELFKLRPDLGKLYEISRYTLCFALMAGTLEEPHLRDFSPACLLSRFPRSQLHLVD